MNIYFIRPELTPHFDPLGVHPHDIPQVGLFDEPTIKTCFNAQWASHFTGMIERLAYEDAWRGTEAEVLAAIEVVRQAIAALDSSEQGNCIVNPFIVGEVRVFAQLSLPSAWLDCNGAAVSRTTYAELFAAIGTTYGVGDGSTTFNLPDLRGRSVLGSGQGSGLTNRVLGQSGGEETHLLTISEMPVHSHVERANPVTGTSGSRIVQQLAGSSVQNLAYPTDNAGGDVAHNNMQPFLVATIGVYSGVP